VGDEVGFKVADFDHGREVSHPTALLAKKITLANSILDADGVVSLPKLKTHGLTRFTGAVKNQFGCVPGLLKRQFHIKMPDPYTFSSMLVDLNTLIRPRLYVMDAIMGMEGNGPFGGKPRHLGVLLLATDPVALDAVACKLINLNPEIVPTSQPGEKSGLGTYHYENIEILGEPVGPLIVRDFQVVRKPVPAAVSGAIGAFIKNRVTPRPVINLAKCTACGTCIQMCPVGPAALDWMQFDTDKKIPRYHYTRCIRCYCCQETCPEGAITVRTPLLGRLFFRS
jgi:Pyruvate/2-oxoacid:ferredoxin oxidoreductase delta subunit